jgi:hypothetical protein
MCGEVILLLVVIIPRIVRIEVAKIAVETAFVLSYV